MEAAQAYLERLDKSLKPAWGNEKRARLAHEKKALDRCGDMAVKGLCDCGRWQKVVRCGREWCPTCGQAGSERHLQRYARWLKRVQKTETAGYWVVTWPPEMREALKSPAALSRARATVRDVLRHAGFDRGVLRWHFVGDERPDVWHPHLNVLVPGGFLPRPKLDAIKKALRQALGLPAKASIHYSYRDTPAKLCHVARYITKPHWGRNGLEWETALALALHGWHNDVWWGSWKDREDQWTLNGTGPTGALIALEAGHCPACGGQIDWRGDGHWRGVGNLVRDGATELAPGYWYAPLTG